MIRTSKEINPTSITVSKRRASQQGTDIFVEDVCAILGLVFWEYANRLVGVMKRSEVWISLSWSQESK